MGSGIFCSLTGLIAQKIGNGYPLTFSNQFQSIVNSNISTLPRDISAPDLLQGYVIIVLRKCPKTTLARSLITFDHIWTSFALPRFCTLR